MNPKAFLLSISAMLLGLAAFTTAGRAQGPLYDRVTVDLPYTVTIGDHTLQPGNYVIRQMPSAGNSRVLLIYSDNGTKFETSAMTIPTLDNRTPEDTKVVLHHYGNDYYVDKIWIQGKNYGYELPLPESVKARERERMQPATVAGTYQAVPAEQPAQTQPPAEAQPPAQAEQPASAQPVAPSTQPAQPAEPSTQPEAAEPQQPVTPPVTTAPPTQPQSAGQGTADRAEQERIPATADNWAFLIVAGVVLGAAGLLLRRRAWSS